MGSHGTRTANLFKSPPPRSIVRTVEPAAGDPVVTVAEHKDWSRIKGTANDAEIARMIPGATRYAEDWMHRALVTQTWQIGFDSFPFGFFSIPDTPQIIELPYSKVISLEEVKVFFDDDTDDDTLKDLFQLDKNSEPGRIILKPSKNWPSGLRQIDAVSITYKSGFGLAAAVPQAIKDAIHYLVADRFENRESYRKEAVNTIPRGAEGLMMPWKIWTL